MWRRRRATQVASGREDWASREEVSGQGGHAESGSRQPIAGSVWLALVMNMSGAAADVIAHGGVVRGPAGSRCQTCAEVPAVMK